MQRKLRRAAPGISYSRRRICRLSRPRNLVARTGRGSGSRSVTNTADSVIATGIVGRVRRDMCLFRGIWGSSARVLTATAFRVPTILVCVLCVGILQPSRTLPVNVCAERGLCMMMSLVRVWSVRR